MILNSRLIAAFIKNKKSYTWLLEHFLYDNSLIILMFILFFYENVKASLVYYKFVIIITLYIVWRINRAKKYVRRINRIIQAIAKI